METVRNGAASASAAAQASSMSGSLEADLVGRERVAARLVGVGGLLVLSAALACVVWYLVSRFGGSDAQQVLLHLDVPGSIDGSVPVIASGSATPSAVGAEFETVVSTMRAFTNGFLVKALVLAMFLMSMAFAIAKQSIVPAVAGIVVAIGISVVPNVALDALGGGAGSGQSGVAVSMPVTVAFDRDHDIDRLRKALANAEMPSSAKSYLLAQAMLIAGKASTTGVGSPFYELVGDTLEKGAPATDLSGASPGVRAQLERLAFGRTVSGPARGFEDDRALARRVADSSAIWTAGVGLDVGLGLLLIAMGLSVAGSVKRVRKVMSGPDVDLSLDAVPDFTTDGSRQIEHMVSMLEKGRA